MTTTISTTQQAIDTLKTARAAMILAILKHDERHADYHAAEDCALNADDDRDCSTTMGLRVALQDITATLRNMGAR